MTQLVLDGHCYCGIIGIIGIVIIVGVGPIVK